MSDKSFRTALFGGFRKKDVVSYLSEEKQRQTEELGAAQERLAAMERELSEAAALRDESDRRAEALMEQVNDLQARESARAGELDDLRAKEAAHLRQEETLKNAADAKEQEILRLEEELAAAKESYDLFQRSSREEKQELSRRLGAMESLCARLSREAEQSPMQRAAVSDDTLDALCGRVERAMGQLERLLAGPYRLVPFEQQEEQPAPPEEAPAEEEPAPVEEEPARPMQPEERESTGLSRLMDRIRRRIP